MIDIYFLPGTMCDQRVWQQVFNLLPAHITPHYIDLPLESDFEKIISSLSNKLPLNAVNLVGFSLGGYLAALFAIKYPEKVNQLLITANYPSKLPLIEMLQRTLAIVAVEKFGYSGVPLSKIHSTLAKSHHHDQAIITLIQVMDRAGGQSKLLSQLKATSARKNLLPQLIELNIPIHFTYGDQDCLVKASKMQSLDSPHITSHQFEHCGHFNPLEAPQALAKQIEQFFL